MVWSDNDGSSSKEYNSEETVEDGSKMIVDSNGESDSEGIDNEHCVLHLQDSNTQDTREPKLVSRPQTTHMPSLISQLVVEGVALNVNKILTCTN